MNITLYSPKDYQVFQRGSKNIGFIRVEGAVKGKITKLWIKISGKDSNGFPLDDDWQPVTISLDKSFSEEIKTNGGGWYKLEIKDDLGETLSI